LQVLRVGAENILELLRIDVCSLEGLIAFDFSTAWIASAEGLGFARA
jgi:hypothetical protein